MMIFIRGDATHPVGPVAINQPATGFKYILHCVNDIGAWGKGFVLSLDKRWPNCKRDYLNWYGMGSGSGMETGPLKLGEVMFSLVENDIVVCHVVGQHGIYVKNNKPPIRYDSLELGFRKVLAEIHRRQKIGYRIGGIDNPVYPSESSIHCPRIGCGLAGGNWDNVEGLLNGIFRYVYDFPVVVYDL